MRIGAKDLTLDEEEQPQSLTRQKSFLEPLSAKPVNLVSQGLPADITCSRTSSAPAGLGELKKK